VRWDVAGLRGRLQRASPPAFAVYGDDRLESDLQGLANAPRPAAVLVPIVQRSEALTLLFTQRTTHLKAHAGQVSFPGGRAEPGDASPEFTALREAEEEIGLSPRHVEIIGRLPDYHTRTGYIVAPIIGLLTPPFDLVPDPREVDEIFEVPLDFLLDPANHRRQTRVLQGRTVGFYEMPYEGRYIWGATAGMIVNLCRILEGEAGQNAPPGG
jgi:8-oxo-dGTP pyrophosphatase MutT (NUDIX family)